MKHLHTHTLLYIIGITALLTACDGDNIRIENMRCEYQVEPLGIETTTPLFTWTYGTDNKTSDFTQQESRIFVALCKKDLGKQDENSWVSNIQQGQAPHQVLADGIVTRPHTRYYWQVEVKGNDGSTVLSPVAWFETAKLSPSDWQASWISDNHDKDFHPSPMLRKSFIINAPIKQARLYISGAAYYVAAINGKPLDRTELNPGYTHYDKRNLYNTYDVTHLLLRGKNVITAVLGNGFFNEIERLGTWDFETARWRGRPRMISELHIVYEDDADQWIHSDDSWKTTTGPYVLNDIYAGDTYDARLAINGWDEPGFDDSSWEHATVVEAPSPLLVSQQMPRIRVEKDIKPVSVHSLGDTIHLFDFGENFTGNVTLTGTFERDTKFTMQHAELVKNGRICLNGIDYGLSVSGNDDLRIQQDVYISDGKATCFTPHFSYHGFQYVEVRTDRPVRLDKDNLTAHFFHTDVKPVGTFSCSNELLNKIWAAVNRSYLSNLMSIPTDCPQREKNGWTADAHFSMDLGLLNFDGITAYEKWFNDMLDNQQPSGALHCIIPSAGWGANGASVVWESAIFFMPLTLYHYYGETRDMERMWDAMVRHMNFVNSYAPASGIIPAGLGDWNPYKTVTPKPFTNTTYYYIANVSMAAIAQVLGKDGSCYESKAKQLKEVINDNFFDKEQALYSNGSETAQALALYAGIVPEEHEQKVANNLAQLITDGGYTVDFGLIGSKTVLRMLSKYGYDDVAYRLASQDKAPSWGFPIANGLTCLPESWINAIGDATSYNHVFLGDISAWMYNVLAGINYDETTPGFRHILIKPHFPDGLDWVKASYQSVNGHIAVEWRRTSKGISLNINIPVNTTATLSVYGQSCELCAGRHTLAYPAQLQ